MKAKSIFTFLKKNESCMLKGIQLTSFLLSITGFAIQSYDSVKKYYSCPQGIEVSTQPQNILGMLLCPPVSMLWF